MKARKLAYTALVKMEKDKSYSTLTLDALLKAKETEPREKQLATVLFYGVLERKVTLDFLIGQYSRKPALSLDVEVTAALELGLYQLLYMENTPPSAAVNESVELIKSSPKKSAAGMVNGVLRSFLRDKCAVKLPEGPELYRMSIEYSMPLPILERWERDYSRETARTTAMACLGRPPLFARVNTLKGSAEEAAARLKEEGVTATLHPLLQNCLELSGTGRVSELNSYRDGFITIQDGASQLCAQALGAKPYERVFDLCAAPGSKSFLAAQMMEDKGEIMAFDLHPSRVELIKEGAARMGISCIQGAVGDATLFDPSLSLADRVLCDVPCAGLGIIRRKPEIRFKKEEELMALPPLQKSILENGARYVKPGGILVYSTCSLCRGENDEVVERFLESHKEFQKEPFPKAVQLVLGNENGALWKQTLIPETGGFDGFFIARMRKKEA